ncbi:hypothetical protein AAG570_004522 [Ranatra chinensis]|uniref:Nucleoporin NSP1-like C-terminal domain-containing protein n=1 Tax=Ranatra chinensis TaxID=642074 RepID=A0ABD0Y2J8_9HEMI
MINKWTVELGEQERQFLNQATQINAWDNLLNSNVSKLTALHNMVEEVKLEQAKINCDLDFILTQQKELDACLIPLEKEYTSSIYTNDVQREKMYSMAENIDSKLKRMSEDLKETIDHINETSRSQESIDPVLQIGRILNAHMNSLQWVDEQCSKLQTEFESVDKIHENMKREIDRQYSSYY